MVDLDKTLRFHAQVEGAMMQAYISGEVRTAWERVRFDLVQIRAMFEAEAKKNAAIINKTSERKSPSAEKRAKQSKTMKEVWAKKRAEREQQVNG